MKKFLITILFLTAGFEISYAQLGSYAGAFSRMGFSARGMGMSNAMVSDIFGDINGIYNPALAAFQEKGIVNFGYTFLSLDRKLNFVGFTKKFKLPKQQTGGAGITIAWINSGVTDIDGRDNDTKKIGLFSTFENEFYLGTSFLLSEQFSLGVGFKLYYAKLFNEITASSIAFDVGALYKATDKLAIGFSIRDIGAKYEWQTSSLYGSLGNTTKDKFPKLADLGASYRIPKNLGIVSLAVQQYFNPESKADSLGIVPETKNNTVVRLGLEINVISQVKFRAGLDRIDLASEDFAGNLKPSFGLGLSKSFSPNTSLGLDYSFQIEPFTHDPVQNLGLVFKFK
ncbi:MAG: PorV/PorQ family protein [bacterium]